MSETARSRRRLGWRVAISTMALVGALVTVLAAPAVAWSISPAGALPAAVFPGTGASTTSAGVDLVSHAPKSRTSSDLASSIAVADHTTRGRASAKANAATTIARHGGMAIVHSTGSLHAAAECLKPSCPGDGQVADAAASTDARIKVKLGAVGTVPYRLTVTLRAGGYAQGPCAAVTVRLVGAERLDAAGPPPAFDCGAPSAGGSLSVVKEGVLEATGHVILRIDAQTEIIDPSARHTDKLHVSWDVTLKLGPKG